MIRRWHAGAALLLLAAALGLVFPVGADAPAAAAGRARVVRVEAGQYRFDPGVVHVRRGDEVTIELVATDVVHGLYLDGYGLTLTAEPGQTARATFVADRPGTFRFRCSVSCGAMHPFMIGKLRVGANATFWGGLGLAFLAGLAGIRLGRRAP